MAKTIISEEAKAEAAPKAARAKAPTTETITFTRAGIYEGASGKRYQVSAGESLEVDASEFAHLFDEAGQARNAVKK